MEFSDDILFEKAREVSKNAYSPYSNVRVGASLITDNNNLFIGTNIENSSYGATICAERSAIFSAISSGEKKIKKICVYTEKGWSPCGMCRQVMKEFMKDEDIIIICNQDGPVKKIKMIELLPYPFDEKNLQK